MWVWLLAGAGGLLLTGVLPLPEALDVLARIAPILGFLVAVTVLAELADGAGVFGVAARQAARLGRGSVRRLFLAVAVLATLTTVILSLDTTAVLLTPVVLALTARLDLPPLPFALLVVWLANTASLLLPVSNLTNLLAVERLDVPYVPLLAAPAVAVLVISVAVVAVRYRRQVTGRYPLPGPVHPADPLLFRIAVAVIGVAGVLFAAEVEPWLVAGSAASVLLLVVVVRARHLVAWSLLPWRLVLTTIGLFLVVQGLLDLGLVDLLAATAGTGQALPDLLRLAGTGAVTSNVVNNLPAYLALEPIADAPARVAALLIGTNAGPLITPWASLATLLWWDRCRARGVRVPVAGFVLLGLVGTPLVVAAGALTLALTT